MTKLATRSRRYEEIIIIEKLFLQRSNELVIAFVLKIILEMEKKNKHLKIFL